MKNAKALLAAAIASFLLVGTGATAATIFTDSFENPVNTRNWQVYADNFGDWASNSGTGIEVQRSGVVVKAHTGNQYIELDSDKSRGGDQTPGTSTNSSMTRTLSLGAGTYSLEWFYQSRTSVLGDNIISVYLAGKSQDLFATRIGTVDGAGRDGWVRQVSTFTVDGLDNDYALTFRAEGKANKLGGFIDSVTLSQVPLPAGLPLLVAGLAALGFAGRRRKA